jgi:hypothetical protein
MNQINNSILDMSLPSVESILNIFGLRIIQKNILHILLHLLCEVDHFFLKMTYTRLIYVRTFNLFIISLWLSLFNYRRLRRYLRKNLNNIFWFCNFSLLLWSWSFLLSWLGIFFYRFLSRHYIKNIYNGNTKR